VAIKHGSLHYHWQKALFHSRHVSLVDGSGADHPTEPRDNGTLILSGPSS
jgi:hypothetical protein